ncbi:MAG TPA: hypothetical protein VFI73_01290 [Candidatus Nitrosopolaris sp.]|nr:hypothetical protein [Candidatus Nitrosopolaris sp.]
MSNNSEVSGLGAFVVGLVLTLSYLGLELRNALSNDTSHGATFAMRLKNWLVTKNQRKENK